MIANAVTKIRVGVGPLLSWRSASNLSCIYPSMVNRSQFTVHDLVVDVWKSLDLPLEALKDLSIEEENRGHGLPSSFKLGSLAQGSILCSALAVSLIHSTRNNISMPKVRVPLQHAMLEFKSEQFHTINGKAPTLDYVPIGGLHKTSDGFVRIHDVFPNHREACRQILGLSQAASRAEVADRCLDWTSEDLEKAAFERHAVISSLRSFSMWDQTPQAKAIPDFPISITKLGTAPIEPSQRLGTNNDKCLRGVRVLEMSRVIAAPLAGKTLAAHGADVLWVTSPSLPAIPEIDCEFGRGKRTIQLDLSHIQDADTLHGLLENADVFIQGYRPGSLAARGLAPESIAKRNPGIIIAHLSAYPSTRSSVAPNPWANNRGFDSMVQTCSGLNVAEATQFDDCKSSPAKPLPCQALDHASGYFLATGIAASLYKRRVSGGSYLVEVSLAGVAKYLRSLGQYEAQTGFEGVEDIRSPSELNAFCQRHPGYEYMEERESGLGQLRSLRHSASIDGVSVGWDVMPKPLGSDEPTWLSR